MWLRVAGRAVRQEIVKVALVPAPLFRAANLPLFVCVLGRVAPFGVMGRVLGHVGRVPTARVADLTYRSNLSQTLPALLGFSTRLVKVAAVHDVARPGRALSRGYRVSFRARLRPDFRIRLRYGLTSVL